MTIDDLKSAGVNVDEGLARCLNDEGFYLSLVPGALTRDRYEELENAVRMEDLDSAFEIAHGLKGILANLALTPLLDPVDRITEFLRARTRMDYAPLMEEIWKAYDRFSGLN